MLFFALLCFAAVASAQSCVGFSYSDQNAWGTISCTNNLCGVGDIQSPIKVLSKRESSSGQLSQLRFVGYADTANQIQIDGESIIYRYSVNAELRNINAAVDVFKPRYFSAHLPPEHTLPGLERQPEMELQLYHTTSEGGFAVVSFFFNVVEEDNQLLSFLNPAAILSGTTKGENVPIKGFQDFLDTIQRAGQDSYYYYKGSLTQPPCTENVHWHLISTVFNMGRKQYDDLAATLSRKVSSGGNARTAQREMGSVLYWDAEANAVTDSVCGGGLPNWNIHPYDCTDQYDHTKCFYCSGRANGFETKNVCLNRNGRECNELFSSPEAMSYCNIAFECPASTLSSPLLIISAVVVLLMNFFW